jgi:predicted nucleotidyltransferase
MAAQLPPDFKEFLQLLNSEGVEYLLVGGYAVSYHGYPRPTGDLDVWVAMHATTAGKLVRSLAKFGFADSGVTTETFMTPGRIIRMGVPPVRIEVLTSVTGIDFAEAFAHRIQAFIDGVAVNVIARDDLIKNKRAAARAKDLNDLEHLEGS